MVSRVLREEVRIKHKLNAAVKYVTSFVATFRRRRVSLCIIWLNGRLCMCLVVWDQDQILYSKEFDKPLVQYIRLESSMC